MGIRETALPSRELGRILSCGALIGRDQWYAGCRWMCDVVATVDAAPVTKPDLVVRAGRSAVTGHNGSHAVAGGAALGRAS